ncbi:hypothetical protein K491DRAFT_303688 [Lophiostoma macrostomum CBS 122681]|uniref:Secreted protein n=1 Tax=Lophiostoma macrostomum CBS 122681 TaxID=1314788 RepID=A0A6A6TDG4_9PLEO|nr:hypothetical protein K491DRAFT_303688 [Lophiostoma macrostomum CBS 122681]
MILVISRSAVWLLLSSVSMWLHAPSYTAGSAGRGRCGITLCALPRTRLAFQLRMNTAPWASLSALHRLVMKYRSSEDSLQQVCAEPCPRVYRRVSSARANCAILCFEVCARWSIERSIVVSSRLYRCFQ